MKRKVTNVKNGEMFSVEPFWETENRKGKNVIIKNYSTPSIIQPGYLEAKQKLKELILHKEIELKNPEHLHTDAAMFDVYFDGKHINEHLPEYHINKK